MTSLKKHPFIFNSILYLFICFFLSQDGRGQEESLRTFIEHKPVKTFQAGQEIQIHVTALSEVEWMRIHFRSEGILDFQVRNMEKEEQNSYFYLFDTSELLGLKFEYYFEARKDDRSIRLPENVPEDYFLAQSESIEQPPETPQEISPEQETKFKLPLQVMGSIQAKLKNPQASAVTQKSRADGNFQISTQMNRNNYQLSLASNFNYTTIPSKGQNVLDLSKLSIKINRGKHLFTAGDVSLMESEYTVYGLGRRGLDYTYNNQKTYIHLFDVNTQQPLGFQGFGLPKTGLNLLGGAIGHRFFNNNFSLKAVYLSGKDDPSLGRNVGFSSFYTARKGQVMALIQEGNLFKNTLALRGEIAYSIYDGNLEDEKESKSDTAWKIGGNYSRGKFTLGANYRHVGRDFNTIGYQYFTSNRNNMDTTIGLNLGKISINGSFVNSRDNVDNNPNESTTKNHRVNSSLMWMVSKKISMNFSYNRNKQTTESDSQNSTLYQNSLTNQISSSLNLSLSQKVTLNFSLNNSVLTSQNNPSTDNSNFMVNLGGSFRWKNFLSLMPTFSYSRMAYKSTGIKTQSYSTFFSAELNFIPQILTTSLSGSYSKMSGSQMNVSTNFNLSGNIMFYLQKLIKIANIMVSLRSSYTLSESAFLTNSYFTLLLQTDFMF
ncbi:hypothetical protein ACFLQZ_01385 [Acidobacteriota bacterium]